MVDQQTQADEAPVCAEEPVQPAVEAPPSPAEPIAASPSAPEPAAAAQQPAQPSPAQSPRAEAKALLDRLRAENRVFRERLPMALGMHRQLASAMGVSGLVARRVCAVHSGSLPYLRHLAAGGPRYDLEGNAAGEVTPEQVETARRQAAELLARRAQQAGAGAQRGKAAASAAPPAAGESSAAPQPRPQRGERHRGATPDAKRAERSPRKPAAAAASRPQHRNPREPGTARRVAASDDSAPSQTSATAVPAASTAVAPAAAVTPTRQAEPRRDLKADPQARNASALAMALSAAIKAAPADFTTRVASAGPSGETTAPKAHPRDRRGRNADRR